jgi:sugar transferase (PEP-CTERM/EpsH1 system associated)
MRTLILCPRSLWPLDTGARQRDFYLATSLAARSEATLVAFCDGAGAVLPEAQAAVFREVISLPKPPSFTPVNLVRGLVGSTPISILNFSSPAMHEALRRELERTRFDTVHVCCVHLAEYVETIRRYSRAKVLCDWHNVESELMHRYADKSDNLARKVYARRTAHSLERAERRMLGAIDGLFVTSQRERDALAAWSPSCPVYVVENGVDMQRFAAVRDARANSADLQDRTRLLFVGSMDYHANVDAAVTFARSAWPAIRQAMPQLRFTIVGRNPTAAVRELGTMDGIEVTGSVPDVAPYYARAAAAIVPLRVGGGTRLKILEAMGFGVPVISTALGIEGLAAEAERDYLRADELQAMQDAIGRLIHDPALANRLAASASELVRSRYDWVGIGAELAAHHRDCAGSIAARAPAYVPEDNGGAHHAQPH